MRLGRQVPVAWLNLTHNKARFLLSILGISFAVVLMFVQLGFWRALLDSQTAILRAVDADLFLISTTMSTITDTQAFPRPRLDQARAVPGVVAARPIYIRYSPFVWKNRELTGPEAVPQWPIRVLAFVPDSERPPLRSASVPDLAAAQRILTAPDTVFIDTKSKPIYDAIQVWHDGGPLPVGVEREVGGRRIRVVGTFRLGTDFTTDGSLLMTARNMADIAGGEALDSVQLGLVQLTSGADRREVLRELRRLYAANADVRVLTPEELTSQEEDFWMESTPIGFVFMLGLIVGFIVGIVICYQVLATEVADHLAEFATLKAIGYHDRYVSGVVIQEALLLSLLGFAAGLAISWPLYSLLSEKTGLPLEITFGRGGLILGLTILMCVLSGFLALRRVRTADPAEVFG
jgi:putative ABC transport system permease protein